MGSFGQKGGIGQFFQRCRFSSENILFIDDASIGNDFDAGTQAPWIILKIRFERIISGK